jgi:hypothetical protein
MVAGRLTNPTYRPSWIECAGDNADIIQEWKTYVRK